MTDFVPAFSDDTLVWTQRSLIDELQRAYAHINKQKEELDELNGLVPWGADCYDQLYGEKVTIEMVKRMRISNVRIQKLEESIMRYQRLDNAMISQVRKLEALKAKAGEMASFYATTSEDNKWISAGTHDVGCWMVEVDFGAFAKRYLEAAKELDNE